MVLDTPGGYISEPRCQEKAPKMGLFYEILSSIELWYSYLLMGKRLSPVTETTRKGGFLI
jgi:hypothetical protein